MDAKERPIKTNQVVLSIINHPNLWVRSIVFLGCMITGIIIGSVPSAISKLGYPSFLGLIAPIIVISVVLFSLLDFHRFVLLTFIFMAFVQVEPAPFDILIIILIGIGLITGRLRLPKYSTSREVWIGIWAFVLINLLSTLQVVPIGHSLRFLLITIYGIVLLIFVRMYVDKPVAVNAVVNGYVIGAGVSVFLAVLGLMDIGHTSQLFTESGLRARAFFKDSNVFAPFLIPPIIITVDRALQRPFSRNYSIPLFLLALWLTFGVILSFSRAAWINLAISTFLYGLLILRSATRKQKKVFMLSIVFIVLIILLVILITGSENFVLQRWSYKSYDEQRFANQMAGAIAGLSNFLGVGPGHWPNSHSLYFRALAEQGLFGLAALVFLIFVLLFRIIKQAVNKPKHEQILPVRVLLPCIVGMLVNSLVIDSIHWRHMWVLFGLIWVAFEVRVKEKE